MGVIKLSNGRYVGGSNPCYIVAEIGQNHQGDLNIAKQLIKAAKESGVDCVKFQKSCLKEKFNKTALSRPYDSANSWGKTYGEHKQYLEFNESEFVELQEYANFLKIDFSASGMDTVSVDFINSLNPPFLKVASNDADSIQFLSHVAKKGQPLFVSTGMQSLETMKQVYDLLKGFKAKFCFLQCTSCYPVPPENAHLQVIKTYQEQFSDIPIGYSGHELGISISIAAVAMGAKVIERHITFDKNLKGSDHSSSLIPTEFKNLVTEIRIVEEALGTPVKMIRDCEQFTYMKLGKTIVAKINLKKNDVITFDNICAKIAEPKGIQSKDMINILGSKVNRDINYDESLFEADLFK